MMDWLTWILLESPLALAGFTGLALFVLLVYWRRTGRPQPLLIALALTIALFVIQTTITTRAEHADHILDAIATDLMRSETTALHQYLAPNFTTHPDAGPVLDRTAFLNLVADRLESIRIIWVERWQLELTDHTDEAFTAITSYRTDIVHPQGRFGPRSGWDFTFVDTPQGWRISQIHCRHIDGLSDPTWQRIRTR